MNELTVPVSNVTREGAAIDVVAPVETFRPACAGQLEAGPVTVHGVLTEAGDEYIFRGRVSATYRRACDRCLEPAEYAFDAAVMWVFARGPVRSADEEAGAEAEGEDNPGDSPGFATFEGDVIDLRPQVWEEVVLAAP